MHAIITWIVNLFRGLFGMSVRSAKMRGQAKVRAQTVGRVQGKVLKAQAAADRKVFRAQDKVMRTPKKAPPKR